MKKNSNFSERFNEMLDFIGVNRKKFAENLQYPRSQTIYDLANGKVLPSYDFFLRFFNSEYSELINLEWLVKGNGAITKEVSNMLAEPIAVYKRKGKIIETQEVPLYNIEASAGLKHLFNDHQQHVIDTIKIPNLPKCDGAIHVTGDSMYPLVKSGDIVLFKETSTSNIFFGEMYLLSINIDNKDEYITVKYVQRSELGREYITLVSQNHHHQSKDILIASITAIAIVKATIRFNTMR